MPTSPGSPGARSRRSNLFVLRMWRVRRVRQVQREDVEGALSSSESSESTEGKDDGSEWQWEGRIQRAVSGEEHHFHGWPDFIKLLEAMLSDEQQVWGRGHTAKKRDGKSNPWE